MQLLKGRPDFPETKDKGLWSDPNRGLILLGLVMAAVTLACALGVSQPSDSYFTPPSNTVQPDVLSEPIPVAAVPAEAQKQEQEVPANFLNPAPTEPSLEVNRPPVLYYAQAGDTLPVVAVRFGVLPEEISSPEPLPETALLHPNQLLIIPNRLMNTTSPNRLLPDSEAVFSPSALDFNIQAFVQEADGYLASYREWLGTTQWTSGADVVYRVALENSINPRLLLALLEFQSGWVYGQPANLALQDYPIGKIDLNQKGLYQQLSWAVNQLSVGYYGWREGYITEIQFSDGATARLAPDLNAGTVALQYFFSRLYDSQGWVQVLDAQLGFPALYERMFGNPWLRAVQVEPLYPPDLTQPKLALPFFYNQMWSFTGGPHGAWEHDGARAALDFAPSGDRSGCYDSDAWALASAPGLVVRSENGVVVLDLDGDGYEQTGWALMYLHIAQKGRIQTGQWVETGDLLGHPSCEGGMATGVHIHIARKYNGEWIPADGPLPFVLSGWMAHAGSQPYQGTLTRDGETVTASVVGSYESRIVRLRDDP